MWIEQWNSLSNLYTDSKSHEMSALTCSYKLNIKINAPILQKVDLRIPAADYTLRMSRQPNITEASKRQQQYADLFQESQMKAKESSDKRKRVDSKKKASNFFGIK